MPMASPSDPGRCWARVSISSSPASRRPRRSCTPGSSRSSMRASNGSSARSLEPPTSGRRYVAAMLQDVGLGDRSLADYTHLVGRGLVEEIRELAAPLQGKRILHVSATSFGGGVSEILYTLVPLMRDVGLDVHWRVILGREEFFNVTKLMHNSLQGDPQTISDQQWEVFEAYNAMNAQSLDDDWDVIIVHDPQPAALQAGATNHARSWIWRCHIDLSTPNRQTLDRLLPLLREYDETIWHLEQYVPTGMDGDFRIIPPAIDPLSPKNMALSPEDAAFVCNQFGIDTDRPPRGRGVLSRDVQLRRRRSRHQDPEQPEQRRRDRGQRVSVAGRRGHPEVASRGIRAHRHRGAVEGAAGGGRKRRWDPTAGEGRRDRLPDRLA